MEVKRFEVAGLFGNLDHSIQLRAHEPTILAGPNGTGKTHLLRALASVAGLDLRAILALPLKTARITYTNGQALEAQLAADDDDLTVTLAAFDYQGRRLAAFTISERDVAAMAEQQELPAWVQRLENGSYYDRRDGRLVSPAQAARIYGRRVVNLVDVLAGEHPWLTPFRPRAEPAMIATGRLDRPAPDSLDVRREARPRPQESAARIQQYVERISGQISDARRVSLQRSQQADRRFAARALDRARASIKESELRARYAQVAVLHEELYQNGLTEESIGIAFPSERTNPTERRILNLFLDDWEAKLAPLLPVHRKLELFREVVGGKLSGKTLAFSRTGELAIADLDGATIAVDMLSSGEQHLLALFAMLLFGVREGALVLIDEPEISLHAAWKHAFLDDLTKVGKTTGLTFVLATHSTAIINGRWELVEELGTLD